MADKARGIAERTEELLVPIARDRGVVIYDVEFVKEAGERILRAYIDREGGVTIDDCEAVSRALSDALDEEDFIPDAYILEVSSPGLGRQLKKDRHLAYSIGEEVEVKTYRDIDGQRLFCGRLSAFNKGTLTIVPPGDGGEMVFDRGDVAVIRLMVDFSKEEP